MGYVICQHVTWSLYEIFRQVGLGDDGGVRPQRQHGGVRRHGQYAHHLRPQQQGRPGEELLVTR